MRTDMLYLMPSTTTPGYWRLGDQELNLGDVIEVWIRGNWYTAQVEYDRWSGQQQLHIRGQRQWQPLTANIPGRWPTGKAQSPTH